LTPEEKPVSRSREEFESVRGVMREIMASGSNKRPIVIIDHQGNNGLDASVYFSDTTWSLSAACAGALLLGRTAHPL
jgi:hypothetical protein